MMSHSDPAGSARANMARAKRPRTLASGPYGHPVHPVLVAIPIGTWIASLVFDIIGFFADDPGVFVSGAMVLIGIGVVGALLAAVFGLMDLSNIAKGTRAHRVGILHMSLNLGAVALFVVNFIVRLNSAHDEVSVIGFVLSVAALVGVGISGWLGGMLAYHYGVRVADEVTQAEGFRPAEHGDGQGRSMR